MVRPRVARGFRRSGRCGLASMYPTSVWSALCSGSSWISARLRSDYRTGLDRAIWVTSVRVRREDRSPSSSHPLADLGGQTKLHHRWLLVCAVPLFVPDGRSFVPACACRRAARKVLSRLAVALTAPLASVLPGHALTGPSTARGSRWTGRDRIGLDAREGAPLVKNRPSDARELVG
jgi:hypothetical protein